MAMDQPTAAPVATDTPASPDSITLSYVADTPTSNVPVAATNAPYSPGSVANDGTHWIDVNLTQQMVYAYSGNTVVNSFLVSTGTWQYPTVTGKYQIYVKLRYTDMSGPDYYLPNVPYTMYFYRGYGLHGTYWHHNFGTPMSHGCVNLATPDAAWLYDFSSVGTVVNIHY
jgi:lipoprotein-anchoring transpeptidase ErfK/SrfK